MNTRSLNYSGARFGLSVITSLESVMAEYDKIVRNTERLLYAVRILCLVVLSGMILGIAAYVWDASVRIPTVYRSVSTGVITKVCDRYGKVVTNPYTITRLTAGTYDEIPVR